MPATEYSTRPREAATSTMQMAMKIVEMRIMSRATLLQRRNLSINVDSMDQCCFGGVGRGLFAFSTATVACSLAPRLRGEGLHPPARSIDRPVPPPPPPPPLRFPPAGATLL